MNCDIDYQTGLIKITNNKMSTDLTPVIAQYQQNKRLVQSEAVDQPKTVITGEFDVSCTIMGNFSQTNFNI